MRLLEDIAQRWTDILHTLEIFKVSPGFYLFPRDEMGSKQGTSLTGIRCQRSNFRVGTESWYLRVKGLKKDKYRSLVCAWAA